MGGFFVCVCAFKVGIVFIGIAVLVADFVVVLDFVVVVVVIGFLVVVVVVVGFVVVVIGFLVVVRKNRYATTVAKWSIFCK